MLWESLGVFYTVKKAQVVLGQSVRARSFSEQRDVAERRVSISRLSIGDVGDGAQAPLIDILSIHPELSVAQARDSETTVSPGGCKIPGRSRECAYR